MPDIPDEEDLFEFETPADEEDLLEFGATALTSMPAAAVMGRYVIQRRRRQS